MVKDVVGVPLGQQSIKTRRLDLSKSGCHSDANFLCRLQLAKGPLAAFDPRDRLGYRQGEKLWLFHQIKVDQTMPAQQPQRRI